MAMACSGWEGILIESGNGKELVREEMEFRYFEDRNWIEWEFSTNL